MHRHLPGRFLPGLMLVLAATGTLATSPGLEQLCEELRRGPECSQAVAIAVERTLLTDNGDDDGFADTHETAQLQLLLRNSGDNDLTHAVATLSVTGSEIECLGRPSVMLGDIPAGAAMWTPPFSFKVSDVDRFTSGLTELDTLTAELELVIEADQPVLAASSSVVLDLDLDVVGGGAPMSYFEDFTSATGLGSFTTMNLDAGRNNFTDSDGFRCQYNDPDWINSFSYGQITDCFLGANPGQADAYFWRLNGPASPDGGRSYSGTHSLYMGIYGPQPDENTTPLAHLEAVALADPIDLGWDRVCENHRTVSCVDDNDCANACVADSCLLDGSPCAGAEDCPSDNCVEVAPRLTYKQQARLVLTELYGTYAGGAVQLQIADGSGNPVGPWIKLDPHTNGYDVQARGSTNCQFDPTDDGNTEDDFFDPTDPDRYFGPSTLCGPGRVVSTVGDTEVTSPDAIGLVASGPGLAGETGAGTWIETTVDLSRWRGRSIRIRFVSQSIKAGGFTTPEQVFMWNPEPDDDGWWIDHIEVTDAATTPATFFSDDSANGGLPGLGDEDGDGVTDACDNCEGGLNPGQFDSDFDGIGDACDNCPETPNTDQVDADLDGLGDACDTCPDGEAADEDGDGVACLLDNCPDDSNAAQTDLDGDEIGDICDACPADPLNDPDGDGWCLASDNCPTAYNADQSASLRLTPADLSPGDVSEFVLDSSGTAAAYLADQERPGVRELYAAPSTTGSPIKLNTDLAPGAEVRVYAYSPDGQRLAYATSELFVVPTIGSPASKLSGAGHVGDFRWTPDSSTLVYTEWEAGPGSRLFAVPATGGVPLELASDVQWFELAGTGNLAVLVNSAGELRSVLLTGGPVKFLASDVGARPPVLTPDRIWVIHTTSSGTLRATRTDGKTQMLSAIGGACGDLSTSDVFLPAPDSLHVVFSSDIDELCGVQLGGPPVLLIPYSLIAFAELAITPDSSTVLAQTVDQGLWSVPLIGGTVTVLVANSLNEEEDAQLEVTGDGAYAVVLGSQTVQGPSEVLRVPLAGGPIVALNPPLVSGGQVTGFALSPDGATLIYRADQDVDQRFELYSVPVSGGTALRVNGPIGWSGGVQDLFALDSTGTRVYYVANQTSPGALDLYRTDLDPDPDGDGALEACDVCPGLSDPAQTDADFDRFGALCECDDADPERHPGAPERCNGLDDDCDLSIPAAELDDDGDDYVECADFVGGAYSGGGDCDDADQDVYPNALEENDASDNQCPGDAGYGIVDEVSGLSGYPTPGDDATYCWPSQAGATGYEVARAQSPDFTVGCTAFATPATCLSDATQPVAGTVLHYLVRATSPNTGSWGVDFTGAEREGCR